MHCPAARGGQRRERWASPAVGGHVACVGTREEQQTTEDEQCMPSQHASDVAAAKNAMCVLCEMPRTIYRTDRNALQLPSGMPPRGEEVQEA